VTFASQAHRQHQSVGQRGELAPRGKERVLRHIAGSNFGLLNQVTGKKIGDGANDPSPETYKTKAQIVAFVKKSVEDGAATIKEQGDAGILKALDYWTGYIEHMGEHYGQLVQYYRDNGVVPPESRPKK